MFAHFPKPSPALFPHHTPHHTGNTPHREHPTLHVPCVRPPCVCKMFLGVVCNVQVITYIASGRRSGCWLHLSLSGKSNQPKRRKNEKQTEKIGRQRSFGHSLPSSVKRWRTPLFSGDRRHSGGITANIGNERVGGNFPAKRNAENF